MSTEKTLHVVAFDVPFPPDYGGVIDVYYRCRSLKNAGYRILLHCFEYGRGTEHDFSAIADEVFYYKRSRYLFTWFSRKPFIVQTRCSKALLDRLLADRYPILFEGQHTTGWLTHPSLANRKKMVRLHNIEWQYYAGLATRSESWSKRWYFRSESRKLKRHEHVLKQASLLACISHSDTVHYRSLFPNVVYLPVSFDQEIRPVEQPSDAAFFLFHGNLGVAENEEAARWLLQVFAQTDKQLLLAGKNPSVALQAACERLSNVRLIPHPDNSTLQQLMQSCSAHLVIGFQHSGIKLKLLHALLTGKSCIVTPSMVAGTGLENWCTVVRDRDELLLALELPVRSAESGREQQEAIRALFAEAKTVAVMDDFLTGKAGS